MEHPRPRLEYLRREIAEVIPCLGDDQAGREELRSRCLSDLLIVYLNWINRLVPPRPRALYFADGFWSASAKAHERSIYEMANRIRRGEDLSPFLSDKASTHGFAPRFPGKRRGPEWGDKDYALNAFGAHHLHLCEDRSRELIYVLFERDAALAILFGDHKSFDDGSLEEAVCRARAASDHLTLKGAVGVSRETTPAQRNGLARRGVGTLVQVGARVVVSAALSTAGTSTFHTMQAMRVVRFLEEWDAKIDSRAGLSELLGEHAASINDPEWAFNYGDLCLANRGGASIFLLVPGAL